MNDGGLGGDRLSPLRSTSMPTEPELEPRLAPPPGTGLDTQMVDLFFDRVPFGLAIFDLDGRLVRCNRTWTGFFELYFGGGPGYTAPGRHVDDLIPGNRDALEQLFSAVASGHVVRQAAHRLSVPGVDTYWDVVFAPLYEDGRLVGVLDVVTDATDRVLSTERLEARIRAFTSVAASMTVDQSLETTLAHIRDALMSTTAATACSLVTWQERPGRRSQLLTIVADPAFGPGYAEAFQTLYAGSGDVQASADDVPAFDLRRDARSATLSDARLVALHPFYARPTPTWDDLAALPLVSGRTFFGELHLHLPAGARLGPDDVGYLRAMADHAALAVENAALFSEQAEAAGSAERQRLARELHDSVSQALFSMTMHASTAERRLAPLGSEADAARAEIVRLRELTKGALAEMRALIFELRPGALAEEGLASALTKQAAALASREQVDVDVSARGAALDLDLDTEEHLYRIALEAMHNAVKHAHPASIRVRLDDDDGVLLLEVADDGIGFDPSVARPGPLGMGTMRERADVICALLEVDSVPGVGTTVRVTLPA